MQIKTILGALLLAVMLAACSGLAGEPEIVATLAPRPTPMPVSVDNPEDLGAAIFAARCASCHGETGRGDGPVAINAGITAPDFTDPATAGSQTIEEWTTTILEGRLENLMPPWKDSLSADEIAAVAEYTYTLWENPPEGVTMDGQDVAGVARPLTDGETDPPQDSTHGFGDDSDVVEVMGSISGDVAQFTEGGSVPDVLSLGLHLLDGQRNQVAFHTQEISNTTQYTFEDIPIRADYTYLVTAIHDDAVFYSEAQQGTPNNPDLFLPIAVYDVTNDADVVEIEQMILLFTQEGESLIVTQFVSFVNTSDRMYRSAERLDDLTYETVQVPLPQDAVILNASTLGLGTRFNLREDTPTPTLQDTLPLFPDNDHVVEIIYALPLTATSDFSVPLVYDMRNPAEIMLEPDVHQLASEQFSSDGMQRFDFGTYEQFSAAALSAGEEITFTLTPLQAPLPANHPAVPDDSQNALALILLVSGIGLIGVSAVLFLIGRRKPTLTKDAILAEITHLDKRYKAGEIDEAHYKKVRAELKRQLADYMQDAAPNSA